MLKFLSNKNVRKCVEMTSFMHAFNTVRTEHVFIFLLSN